MPAAADRQRHLVRPRKRHGGADVGRARRADDEPRTTADRAIPERTRLDEPLIVRANDPAPNCAGESRDVLRADHWTSFATTLRKY